MSLVIISSELVWLWQPKFTQAHTSVHARLFFLQLHVLLHPRLHPHFTNSSQLQGLEDSDILLEHNDVWSCQTPNHNRPETGGVDGFPRRFSKSLLRNVLVEYAVLVSQLLLEDSPLRCAIGVQEPPILVHFCVYFGLV